MDPGLGRFISEDPARYGSNWYIYGGNNPVTNIDPTGMAHEDANGNWIYDDWDFQWNSQYNSYNFWLYNDDFFAYGVSGWWNDQAKLNFAWQFLGLVDFDSKNISNRDNFIIGAGYNIPYYESRRIQTIQRKMGIDVTGWFDEQTSIAAGTLRDINFGTMKFDLTTWQAMEAISSSEDRYWKFNQYYQKYKGNLAEAQLGDLVGELIINAAIYGGGKALLSKALPEAVSTVMPKAVPTVKVSDTVTVVNNTTETTALALYYPPNDGFLRIGVKVLKKGDLIDRYGSPFGRFASPCGTPLEMRALPYDSLNAQRTVYRVVQPVMVLEGPATPWFGQIGMGTQYKFFLSVQDLVDLKILEVVVL